MTTDAYCALTPRMMLQLTAPHTWVAAILPVLVGAAFGVFLGFHPDPVQFMLILVVCVLMQGGVNTLNDYIDFKKGADSKDNQVDATDAVMVFNNVNPRHVFIFFLVLMGVALIGGLYLVLVSSWYTLAIGIIGALILVIYSAGKFPLSYLPLGELASGLTMGGLIFLVTVYITTGVFNLLNLLVALPLILGIGLINFTNNLCDIEKDIQANRHTFPVTLGRGKARKVYRLTLFLILVSVVVLTLAYKPSCWYLLVVFALLSFPMIKGLLMNPFVLGTRKAAMSQAVSFNVFIGAFYALCFVF